MQYIISNEDGQQTGMTDDEGNLILQEVIDAVPAEDTAELSEEDALDIIASDNGKPEKDYREIEQLGIIAESLESLAETVKRKGFGLEEHSELLRSVDSATANAFRLPVESVKLGLESGTVTTIVALVKAIWKAIKDLLDALWKKADVLAKALNRTIPNIIAGFDRAVKFAGKLQGLPSNGRPIELGPEGRFLRNRDYDTFHEPGNIGIMVEDLANAGKWVLVDYGISLVDVGVGIYNGLASFDLNDSVESLRNLDAAISKRCRRPVSLQSNFVQRTVDKPTPIGELSSHLTLGRDRTPRFTEGAFMSPTFIGNCRFYLVEKQFDKRERDSESVLLDSQAYQGLYLDFLPDEVFDDKLPTRYTVDSPLTLGQVMQIADSATRLLMYVQSWYSGKILGRIEYSRKAIEKKTVELNAKAEQMEEFSPDAVQHYRTALTYNIAYNQWVTKPAENFIRHATNVAQAALILCNKSLNSYVQS